MLRIVARYFARHQQSARSMAARAAVVADVIEDRISGILMKLGLIDT